MIPGATLQSETVHDTSNDRMDAGDFTFEESETLSDIDDVEVCEFSDTISFMYHCLRLYCILFENPFC